MRKIKEINRKNMINSIFDEKFPKNKENIQNKYYLIFSVNKT
jgi:hypothetical protein